MTPRPRLSARAYQVLSAIERGHDYAWAVARHTDIPESGLRNHIMRLVRDGYLQSIGITTAAVTRGRPRRVYVLTPLGARVMRAEKAADAAWAAEEAA